MLGPLAELLTISDGAQEAIAAALGAASGAVAVAGLDAAVAILTALKDQNAGRAGLIIGSPAPDTASRRPPADADTARSQSSRSGHRAGGTRGHRRGPARRRPCLR